jgi:hypothetical protein
MMSARGMKENSGRVAASFFKIFDANYAYDKDGIKRAYDNGNPFGPHYDPSGALSNRIEALHWGIPVERADPALRENIIRDSIEVLVYLVRLRYVHLANRNKWRQTREYDVRDGF